MSIQNISFNPENNIFAVKEKKKITINAKVKVSIK